MALLWIALLPLLTAPMLALVGLAMHKLPNRLRLVMSHEQNNGSLSRAMTMALLALGALVFAKRPLEEAHKC